MDNLFRPRKYYIDKDGIYRFADDPQIALCYLDNGTYRPLTKDEETALGAKFSEAFDELMSRLK